MNDNKYDEFDVAMSMPMIGPSDYALSDGQVIGQYRIIKQLGKGGMGEVYLAENTMMRKRVALKLLPRAATSGTFVDRFRIEARVMADLNHPNIVQVHHAGEENGQYYLTMDYICSPSGEPQTLEEVLAEKGRLSEGEVKEIALQICDALELAHGKGLVHRDLKPANILLAQNIADANNQSLITNNCPIKICDFGLAKVVGDDYLRTMIDRSINLSMAGELSLGDEPTAGGDSDKKRSSARAILGTYDYMAPEQKAGGEISPQTDLYAVGIILYRLLTGEKPEGMFEMPSELGCDAAWDGIVRTCMQKKPERRPESAAALRGLVKAVVVCAKGEEEKLATKERKERKKGNLKKKVLLGVVGVGVVAGAIGLGSLWGSKQEPEPQIMEKAVTPKPKPAPKKKVAKKVEPIKKALPSDLVEVSGASTANSAQKRAVAQTSLPLEVKSRKTDIAFRLVPAGTFTMGSPSNEENRSSDETQHSVTISKPFYCGKFEVTQAQWKQVMGTSPSKFQGSENPVEQVSWDDCQTFLKKLCDLEGVPQGTYRLLTEAQWEYACRAGTTTPFCYGNRLDSTMANFDGNYPYGGASKKVYRKKTVSVGQFKPNAWGMYDMHGNVWEWCSDWYGDYSSGSVTDPTGVSSGSYRVRRGGSWSDNARYCRSAYRCRYSPGFRYVSVGFRLLRIAPNLP